MADFMNNSPSGYFYKYRSGEVLDEYSMVLKGHFDAKPIKTNGKSKTKQATVVKIWNARSVELRKRKVWRDIGRKSVDIA